MTDRRPIPIKTASEITAQREGGKILAEILRLVGAKAVVGVSTGELDAFARELAKKYKVEPSFLGYGNPPFPAMLCTSINDEVVHGIPRSNCILRDGDLVKIDCGVFHKGLHTDSCITVMVGKVTPNEDFFVKTMKKALEKGIKTISDGVPLGDVSNAIQKTVEQAGFSVVRDCTGHGVGRKLHEPPQILNYGKRGTPPILRAGMVLAIEPIGNMGRFEIEDLDDGWTIVTKDGSKSAQWEHTVLVTENGSEILTL